MTPAFLFMAIVPFALLMVLVFAMVSGRLSEGVRNRVQWTLILTVYPLMILHFGWQAWERQQGADWPGFGIFLVATGILAIQFVFSLRSGVLFPRFRSPKT